MPFPLLIPAFFFSSWLLMIFWGMVAPDVGVATVGYPKAMLVTIGLWLVVFPLASRGGGKSKKKSGGKFQFVGSMGRGGKKKGNDRGSRDKVSDAKDVDSDEINVSSSFTGISRRVTSQNFKGGSVTTNFGGVELDLTGARIAAGGATLDIKAFVGGVEIVVPGDWDVEVDVATTIAGISDERDRRGVEGGPKLTITGSATLGGISLKD